MRESSVTSYDAKVPRLHFWSYPPEMRLSHYTTTPYISLQARDGHAPETHTAQGTEHDRYGI